MELEPLVCRLSTPWRSLPLRGLPRGLGLAAPRIGCVEWQAPRQRRVSKGTAAPLSQPFLTLCHAASSPRPPSTLPTCPTLVAPGSRKENEETEPLKQAASSTRFREDLHSPRGRCQDSPPGGPGLGLVSVESLGEGGAHAYVDPEPLRNVLTTFSPEHLPPPSSQVLDSPILLAPLVWPGFLIFQETAAIWISM